jgi:hypothetical protein
MLASQVVGEATEIRLPCLSHRRACRGENASSSNGIAHIPFFIKRCIQPFLAPKTSPQAPSRERGRAVYPARAAWIAGDTPGHNAAMFRASRTVLGHATRLRQLHYGMYRVRFSSIRLRTPGKRLAASRGSKSTTWDLLTPSRLLISLLNRNVLWPRRRKRQQIGATLAWGGRCRQPWLGRKGGVRGNALDAGLGAVGKLPPYPLRPLCHSRPGELFGGATMKCVQP